jgi:hypothetical protein
MKEPVYEYDDSFRDTIATADKEGKRIWVYPRKPKGNLTRLRNYATIVYLFLFFSLPFIKIKGEPFFLLNIIERKFVLFGMVFWPQDFFLLVLAMITFMVFIVLFTVVFGSNTGSKATATSSGLWPRRPGQAGRYLRKQRSILSSSSSRSLFRIPF